jgi:hypothetical protein
MQPLNKSALKNFLQRFANFEGAIFQSLKIISATQIRVTLDVQDSAKEFDWVRLMLEFSEISDAKLMDDAKLSLVDLSEGISLLHESDSFAITFEHYETIESLKNSSFYIIAKSIKYEQTTI